MECEIIEILREEDATQELMNFIDVRKEEGLPVFPYFLDVIATYGFMCEEETSMFDADSQL